MYSLGLEDCNPNSVLPDVGWLICIHHHHPTQPLIFLHNKSKKMQHHVLPRLGIEVGLIVSGEKRHRHCPRRPHRYSKFPAVGVPPTYSHLPSSVLGLAMMGIDRVRIFSAPSTSARHRPFALQISM